MAGHGSRALAVWMNGQRVGVWSATRSGVSRLDYDPAWVDSRHGRPLSLSLPFLPGNDALQGPRVSDWFDNLLPDSNPIRSRLAARFGVDARDAHALLAEIGRDCVGAVQLMAVGATVPSVGPITGTPVTDVDVARHLRAALTPPRFGNADHREGEFRISIAGAQEKAALLWHDGQWHIPKGTTPTTHIFKLPLGLLPQGLDLRTSIQNEWLCGRLLAAMDLPIAQSRIQHFPDDDGGITALIVERFDRRLGAVGGVPTILRLPQEDFCQATATPSARKYESDGGPTAARILSLLGNGGHGIKDQTNFVLAQLAFWLLGAIDGHAKNFSIFLLAGGSYAATPLYDVLSAWPIEGHGPNLLHRRELSLAMSVRGERRPHRKLDEVHRDDWRRLAATLPDDTVFAQMEALVDAVPSVIATVETELTPDFPSDVWEKITGGLRSQQARYLHARAVRP